MQTQYGRGFALDDVIINSPLKATKVIIVAFMDGLVLTNEPTDWVFVSEIANPFNQIRLHIRTILSVLILISKRKFICSQMKI